MKITIRLAKTTEYIALEALQLRASLMWEDDRELLLANPHAIELPTEYIEAGYIPNRFRVAALRQVNESPEA
ncbi:MULTISPECIES: hypothetical protein [Photorhabdus]|uniref:Uncharacterized protein n=2 Tax=Photorhabdus asymbiotica TaxID=291112 RepID=B6VLQ7_PHOAA|nr:hypothetical protein [Photorhabdus asymbiotica]RKS60042.1 hypothetical protein BDD30_2158 [Photorhabdus asymbiotica]CAQ86202.1 conserved hypothetical protein [Photorhabdus asymbiotica]CAR67087.1 Conserved Hypothetical Protein [Photorhabdus asymbiotica subsp. asymbiotica ATCC 43949]